MKELMTNNLPSFLQNYAAAKDTSHMEAEDFSVPSLILVQPTSEIAGENPATIGKFVDSLTGKVYDELRVYNIGMKKVFRVVGEDPESMEYFGHSFDRREAEEMSANTPGSKVVEGHQNFVVNADNNTGLSLSVLYSYSKSAIRSSRDWNTAIVMEYGNLPRQALIWKLTPKKIKYAKGNAVGYVYQAQVDGHVPDEPTLQALIDISKKIF